MITMLFLACFLIVAFIFAITWTVANHIKEQKEYEIVEMRYRR